MRRGVFTWDVICRSAHGPLMMQVPRSMDRASPSGRRRAEVPRQSAANAAHYLERGLQRYLTASLLPVQMVSGLPVHFVPLDESFRSLTFGSGQARLDLSGAKTDWVVGLGPQLTAEVLTEIVAAVAYHYELEEAGGTTIADLFLNDGDFGLKRLPDDSLSLRLHAVRRRESGVSPARLLLHLTQMVAYQDFHVAGSLIGVPTLVSNPSIAFEGLVRGRRFRALDLGQDPSQGEEEARAWIAEFSTGEDGRAYAPWVSAFLEGELPLRFGTDLRECWWQLRDIAERANLASLVMRHTRDEADRSRASALAEFWTKCAAGVGRFSASANWNDLTLTELRALLESAGEPVSRAPVIAESIIKRWPFRSFDHLLAEVPTARKLRKLRGKSGFGSVMLASEEAECWRRSPESLREAGPFANRELFGATLVESSEIPAALELCNSFESYMDSALQDESWGYYAHSVLIGDRGHFTTQPEKFSPDYGRWLGALAFELYRTLRARGELQAEEPFWIVEFGAGNGRMATDLLLASRGLPPHPSIDEGLWSEFSRAIRYRIYEKSALLRAKQRASLGETVLVEEGDARRPAECLQRDFTDGLRGLVITNEVPDAFGVHKVALTRDGAALAALVLPSISESGRRELSPELRQRISLSDERMRKALSCAHQTGGSYLDRETFQAVMVALSHLPSAERVRLTLEISIREVYVPARFLPVLKQHLIRNLEQYAIGLAEIDCGLVLYPNPHADRFIAELGQCIRGGYVVTIDYGADSLELFRSARRGDSLFRGFLDGAPFAPVTSDPYGRIGLQDLTADVNFTALALAGERSGLHVVHFGPERDLAGPFLPELLDQRGSRDMAAFLGSPFFKVLIQSPTSGPIQLGPLASESAYRATMDDLGDAARVRALSLCEALMKELGV